MNLTIDDLRDLSYFLNALNKATREFGIDIMERTELYSDGEVLGWLTIESGEYKFEAS